MPEQHKGSNPTSQPNRRRRRPRKPPLFVALPTDLLLAPPVDHWDPFDFAVVAGILNAARVAREAGYHKTALAAGQRAMEEEGKHADEFRREWREVNSRRFHGERVEAPLRRHTYGNPSYKPENFGTTVKTAGREAYKRSKLKQRNIKNRGESKPIEIIEGKRAALLGLARIDPGGDNLKRLDETLTRLCQPVPMGDYSKGPLLQSWETLPSKRLKLRVSSEWLRPPFKMVPLPLVKRSRATCGLNLWLKAIDTSEENRRIIGVEGLCGKIGIGLTDSWEMTRNIDRALKVVNRHMASLDRNALALANVDIPGSYKIVPIGGKIRFVAAADQVEQARPKVVLRPVKFERVKLIRREPVAQE